MATEEWIQESLGRLESLEEERKRHEDALETESDPSNLRVHAQAIERLEVKIRALYAELEAVAASDGDGDGDDVGEDDDELDEAQGFVAAPVASPTPVAPAPAPFAAAPAPAPFAAAPAEAPFGGATASSPFGGPPASSPFGGGASSPESSPFGGPPAASPFGDAPSASGFPSTPESYASSASTYDDSDSDGGGSGSKAGLIIALVLVLGGAVGAYLVFGRAPAVEEAPAAPPTEVKVIKSGEVPPDTQGPRAAKGGDVDVAHGAQIKETERRVGGGGGGGSHTPSTSDAPKKKKEDKATKIEQTDDPLGGIR